jgi:hypothetical protein
VVGMRETMATVISGVQDWAGLVFGTTFAESVLCACDVVGAGSVKVSTSAVGKADVAQLEELQDAGVNVSLHVCFDLVTMNKKWIGKSLGDKFRMHRSHAKCCVARGDGGVICMLTSANLTRNYRWETYLLSSDDALAENLEAHLAEIDRMGSEPWKSAGYYNDVFSRMFGGAGTVDADLMALVERWKS